MPMKPFTRVTPGIEEGCVSAVSLVDTKGNTFNCNFVEVSPIIGQGALSYFTASVSAQGSPLLGSDTHGSSGVMASAGPSSVVGVTRTANESGPGIATIDLPLGMMFNEVQILNECGDDVNYIVNYGVKVVHGQGWKLQLESLGI